MEKIKLMDNDFASLRLQKLLSRLPDNSEDDNIDKQAVSYAIDQLNLMSHYIRKRLIELNKKWGT